MGSMSVPLPINYTYVMIQSLEIIGNFMFSADAHLKLLKLLRSGQLDLSPIVATVFPFTELPDAARAAALASNFECVVIRNSIQ